VDSTARIRAAAAELGFAGCGFAAVEPLPRRRLLRDWLAEGRAGDMVYLRRRFHTRLDPRVLFPWARAVVSLIYPYAPPPAPPPSWRAELRGRVAAYALGADYHQTVGGRLRRLAGVIVGLGPGVRAHPYVDTGPVLEREWARRGGLGWVGRNTMLLDGRHGSWFFLAEIFTSLPLPTDAPAEERCGTCRRCLDACPTGALGEDLSIDPRVCIAYLTIEHRGPIPPPLRPRLANWIFGCDVCQEVCPWNEGAGDPRATDLLYPRLAEVLALDETGFRNRYGHTAISRAKRSGLARNAAVALGNSDNRDAVAPLAAALREDRDAIVRAHSAWALGRLAGPSASAALERARTTEPDAGVRSEIAAALARARDDPGGALLRCQAGGQPLT
jgi:epoxyqueuosine reductase